METRSRPNRCLPIITILLLAFSCSRTSERPAESRPPIILISIDTLRSDHLPAYGYRGVGTPHIDALRADSILFTSAWSNVPLTLPSHVSMLTGLLPPEHGVRNNLGYRFEPAKHRPVTLELKKNGYATGGAVSAYVLRGETGMREAFDFYEDSIGRRGGVQLADLQRPGLQTAAIAEKWIASHASLPFFLMLHLFEPHAPYEPPPKYSHLSNPYDGEIAAADEIVGRLIDHLRRIGIYESAAIILTSDHGEGLNDHGEQEHGIFLYREAIQIPLLIKLPRQQRKGTSIESAVQIIDIAPTVASLGGLTWNGPGRSLLDIAATTQRRIYSETYYPRIHLGWSELRGLTDGRHHYIEAPRAELYDLKSDPGERTNILSTERRIYASMKRDLSATTARFAQPSRVDPEDAARLAALGYLTPSVASSAATLLDPKDGMKSLQPMHEAMRLSAGRKRKQAILAYRRVLSSNPGLVAAWSALARDLEAEGMLEEAAKTYGEAARRVPEMASNFHLERGNLLLRMGRLDEAERSAQAGATASAAAAHHLSARIALARRDFAQAEREARLAMSDSGDNITAVVTLAQALSASGRREEALAILDAGATEATRKGMTVEFLHLARGDLYVMLNRRNEAREAFSEEIQLFPHHLRAYANLAAVELLEERPSEANTILERMVSENPRAEAYGVAARLYQTFGDERTAARWRTAGARSEVRRVE